MAEWINNALNKLNRGQVDAQDQLSIEDANATHETTDRKSWIATTWIGRFFRYIGRKLYGSYNEDNRRTNNALLDHFRNHLSGPVILYLERQIASKRPLSYGRLKKVVEDALGVNEILKDEWKTTSTHRNIGKIPEAVDRHLPEYQFFAKSLSANARESFICAIMQVQDYLWRPSRGNLIALRRSVALGIIDKFGISSKGQIPSSEDKESTTECFQRLLCRDNAHEIKHKIDRYAYNNLKERYIDIPPYGRRRILSRIQRAGIQNYIEEANDFCCMLEFLANRLSEGLRGLLGPAEIEELEADRLAVKANLLIVAEDMLTYIQPGQTQI